jgi:hypothetical protein
MVLPRQVSHVPTMSSHLTREPNQPSDELLGAPHVPDITPTFPTGSGRGITGDYVEKLMSAFHIVTVGDANKRGQSRIG